MELVFTIYMIVYLTIDLEDPDGLQSFTKLMVYIWLITCHYYNGMALENMSFEKDMCLIIT